MQVCERTCPVPKGVWKQLFEGAKSLPERQMQEPDRWLRGGNGVAKAAVFSPLGS